MAQKINGYDEENFGQFLGNFRFLAKKRSLRDDFLEICFLMESIQNGLNSETHFEPKRLST